MKPFQENIFKPIEGIWQNVSGDSETLAEALERLNIIIDDKCQFARIKDYKNSREIWYRAYTLKITITIWKIEPK